MNRVPHLSIKVFFPLFFLMICVYFAVCPPCICYFAIYKISRHVSHIPHKIIPIQQTCIVLVDSASYTRSSGSSRINELNGSAKQGMKQNLINSARLLKWPMTLTLSNEVST